ncbi:MAG: thiamine-phosphate kinase [Acidimicrobiales bacterium]
MGSPKRPPVHGDAPGFEDAVAARVAGALGAASGPAPPGQIWIGDDAAVLDPSPGRLVLATDAVVEGVHVDLGLVSPSDAGWKAMAAALSDIGAMGARPRHALVALGAPPGTDVDAVMAGVAEASVEWRCPVVGGDLSAAPVLVISVAVAGVLDGDGPPVPRGGARPGDELFVTGPLGSSAAGLGALKVGAADMRPVAAGRRDASVVRAHRRPRARLAEGVTARAAGATAMIDVSDGLALDLHRLADASGVGFALQGVPVADGATADQALGGGEDYELVIATADAPALEAAFASAGLRPPIGIGRCVGDPAHRTLDGEPLARLGWQHRFG